MMKRQVRKQNIFVPQYEGKSVFEEYHGVPASQYLQKAKEALDDFVRQNQCEYTVRTLNERRALVKNPSVSVENDALAITVTDYEGPHVVHVKPTKWGTDTVSFNVFGPLQKRLWLFDGNTLDEFDLVCGKQH